MTRAEYDAEFKRMVTAFVDGIAKVLDRFPGAREAVAAEVERQEQVGHCPGEAEVSSGLCPVAPRSPPG